MNQINYHTILASTFVDIFLFIENLLSFFHEFFTHIIIHENKHGERQGATHAFFIAKY